MQKHTPEGVQILCDFSGEVWDGESEMIEGHRGSVISLKCLANAIKGAYYVPLDGKTNCTMCRKPIPAGEDGNSKQKAWRNREPEGEADPEAIICWDCIQQADRAFSKDPDIEWERQIEPDSRWR